MLRTIQKLFYLHYLANDSCVDSFWLESYLQHCGPELGMVWEFSVFFKFISDLFVDIVIKNTFVLNHALNSVVLRQIHCS